MEWKAEEWNAEEWNKMGNIGREYCIHVVTYIYFVNSALSLIHILHK